MRKIMALPMAAIVAFTVTGCGSNKPVEATATGTATAETATESSTTAADTAAEREISGAASSKEYIINTDTAFTPSESENEKREMVGIDLDILQAVTRDQGLECEVVPVGFSAAITALEAGECNGVITGVSITDEGVQKYDFSEPYYDSGVGMAVLVDSDVTSYDQLKDQKVAAEVGTEDCTFAKSIAEQCGFETTQYKSSSDIYQTVLADEAVACFEDYPIIGYEIPRGLSLTLPTPKEKGSSYDFATLKGANPGLVEMFNKGLENIKASDRYDEILNTYIAKQGLLEKIVRQCCQIPVPAKCKVGTSIPLGYG